MQGSIAPDSGPLPERRRGRVTVIASPQHADKIDWDELMRLPAIVAPLPGRTSRQQGRPSAWEWRPSWYRGPGLVVRRYVHGGAIGPALGGVFLGSARMRRELAIVLHALRHGVPTAPPVAVRIERVLGPFTTGYWVSEKVPGARNLLDICREAEAGASLPSPWRCRASAAIARTVGAMHDAGIVHADLNLKNILLRDSVDGPEAFVIDFDGARLMRQVPLRARMRNLLRLERSVLKWTASRTVIGPHERVRFLRDYLRQYPGWTEHRADILRRYASRHLRHIPFRQQGDGTFRTGGAGKWRR